MGPQRAWSHPGSAPATLALLASVGAPVTADETPFELTTPTGAAILAALATFRRPPMRLHAVGYGFGARRMERPNALRVWLGDMDDETDDDQDRRDRASAEHAGSGGSSPVLLETNIDDQPAEQIAYVTERLREGGGARCLVYADHDEERACRCPDRGACASRPGRSDGHNPAARNDDAGSAAARC